MSNNRIYDYFIKDKAIPSPTGSRKRKQFQLVTKGNNLFLKEIGEIDIVDQIQSHRDGVDLAKMIKRFQRGDDTALMHSTGFYGDVSGFATNPAEVINNTRVLSDFGKNQTEVGQDPADGSDQIIENNTNTGKDVTENA